MTDKQKNTSPNGTKKSPKACVTSFPVLRLGMYSKRAAASGQERGGGSPPGWVPSLQAGNQLGQGLYLNLVPFDTSP
ncbi:hypothetical protein [Nostoc sp. NOS(2021)]|uniref:hypothetical protein n=1 Tax=Nostoc sp. NOS(2021) TaxID=2815407 RepID=UPI0025D8BCDA|nr:hypothetical protein [Nostoc sp. NOS(2021)]